MSGNVVHILLPTCEPRPEFLRAAIDSVAAQTEQRWMLHINDDASTIDVRAIIAPYLADPRIAFSRNSHRLGLGGNWNACLKKIPEPDTYVQFLFQDDLWDFGYLARTLRIMEEHPTVGFISTEHDYACEKGIATATLYDELRRFRREYITPGLHRGKEMLQWWLERGLHPNIMGEPSFVLLRRRVVEDAGLFDRRMQQNLDVEYWTRMLEHSDWYYCTENGGVFRVHRDGASERNRRRGFGLIDRLHTIERVLRRSGKGKREQASLLERAAAQMIRKRLAIPQENRPRALRHLPLLSFALRHPIVTVRAAAQAWKSIKPCSSQIPQYPPSPPPP